VRTGPRRVDRRTRRAAQHALLSGERAVVVEVADTQGSVPRERGSRMLVHRDHAVGTIGGGHLELEALRTARAMLEASDTAPRSAHFALGPALGQCCGGTVTLAYSALDAEALRRWPESPPLFHLQLHGAGHVGRAVATLLTTLDAEVDWIDERVDEFPSVTTLGSAWPSHVRRLGVDAVDAEVRTAPAGAFFLVLTHSHDLDLRITEAVLRRGDFGFLGLIGSKTKRQRFIRRLAQRGIDAAALARMTCPIGVEGIRGKQPEVLALAVVAQLLQATSSGTR